jgi:hypothetical protein
MLAKITARNQLTLPKAVVMLSALWNISRCRLGTARSCSRRFESSEPMQ